VYAHSQSPDLALHSASRSSTQDSRFAYTFYSSSSSSTPSSYFSSSAPHALASVADSHLIRFGADQRHAFHASDYQILTPISQRIEDLAVAKQYSDLLTKTTVLEKSGDGLFAKLYLSSPHGSPIKHAIEAHALVRFSEAYKDKAVQTTASHHYASALKMIQQSLNDPRSCRAIDIGIAVWMMASYEYLTGDAKNFQRFQSHIRGLLVMLTLRDPADLDTDKDFSEFFYTVTSQIIPAFIRRAEPFPKFSSGEPWLNSKIPFKGGDDPLDFFIRIGSGVVDMRARCKILFSNDLFPPPEQTCVDLIAEARHLDTLLDGWYASLPASWKCYELEPRDDKYAAARYKPDHQPWNNRRSWPEYRHIYRHGHISDYLSHYFFLRLHAWVTICRASNVMPRNKALSPYLSNYNVSAQLRLRGIADDYCASACTFFTDEGYNINDTLITLAHFKMCEAIPVWQREWIDGLFDIALHRFGKSHAPTLKSLRPCLLTGRSEFGPPGYGKGR